MFEVKWMKPFATNFFGQFVGPGGLMFVPATLAIQLHEEKEGWICEKVEEVRASLSAGNAVVIANVPIDEITVPPMPASDVPVALIVVEETLRDEIHPVAGPVVEEAPVVEPTPVVEEAQGEMNLNVPKTTRKAKAPK